MQRIFLAIDIGASSGRHIVGIEADGALQTDEVYRFPNGMQRENGHLIWDIEGIFQHVKAGIKAAFAKYPHIDSLSIDTWAVDYVLLKDGAALLPCHAYRDERTEAFMARMGDVEPIGVGSSLTFCMLAEGAIDVYPRFAPTSEWDTGAAQCVVEAAGGAVVDPRGRPLSYNQRDTILNGDFIALGDTSLPWRDWI